MVHARVVEGVDEGWIPEVGVFFSCSIDYFTCAIFFCGQGGLGMRLGVRVSAEERCG